MRFAFLISFIIYRHSLKHKLLNILWDNKSIWLNYLLNSKINYDEQLVFLIAEEYQKIYQKVT